MNTNKIDRKKWLKRFLALFSKEPTDRDALIELLRKFENKNLFAPDALLMIEGALHVSELQVRDIMIPKVQMVSIENDAKPEEIISVVVESGHSRFPVINTSTDEIVGILLAKDLLNFFVKKNTDFILKDVMRTAVFVPKSKRLDVLLREFRTSRNHMAVVIDEYTSVAGLVTIEDVIEEIIGDIEDEHDLADDQINIVSHDNDRYSVRALTPIDEFNRFFKKNLKDEEHDTIGGFIINAFSHLPKRGETINFDEFHVKILRADKRRVHLLLLTRFGPEERQAST